MIKFISVSVDIQNLRYTGIYIKDGVKHRFDMKSETEITLYEFMQIIEMDEKD